MMMLYHCKLERSDSDFYVVAGDEASAREIISERFHNKPIKSIKFLAYGTENLFLSLPEDVAAILGLR